MGRCNDPNPTVMARLSDFIRDNTEQILSEWETFARTLPTGETMDIVALRDHAKQMLGTIARDLDTPQTNKEQADKSKGKSDSDEATPNTAAQEHGSGRAGSGFTIEDMVSEFRALRASVIRLWSKQQDHVRRDDMEDMIRFNEAIDQAIAESITQYTHDIGQSKERFLAILGHDLRTPLSSIITSTSFMLETAKTSNDLRDPYLKLITRISSTAWRMNRMVSDLLDFARTSFGDSIPIERAKMDLERMIGDVVSEVSGSYPASPIRLETHGDLRGEWDCERLTQAVTNLIANAVQHGASKSPIAVSARGTPSEAVISVHNEGPAIAKSAIDQIFNAMKEATGGARDDQHLGLGLYIVDQIVKSHGGCVDVTSSASAGTTFTIHLPRQVAKKSAAKTTDRPARAVKQPR